MTGSCCLCVVQRLAQQSVFHRTSQQCTATGQPPGPHPTLRRWVGSSLFTNRAISRIHPFIADAHPRHRGSLISSQARIEGSSRYTWIRTRGKCRDGDSEEVPPPPPEQKQRAQEEFRNRARAAAGGKAETAETRRKHASCCPATSKAASLSGLFSIICVVSALRWRACPVMVLRRSSMFRTWRLYSSLHLRSPKKSSRAPRPGPRDQETYSRMPPTSCLR